MNDGSKKTLIMGTLAGVLLIAAALLLFKDSIFGSSNSAPVSAAAQADAAKVAESVGGEPEPEPANPPPRGSGKKPSH